jgi:aubergine-like protein
MTFVFQVVTIFSGPQRADRYAAVKKLCYIEKSFNSQCIMQKSLSNEKRMQAVCQKIVLQMNCKLGGELWGCKVPMPNLMVVGMDVYKDKSSGAGGGGGNIAAIVSSLNGSFSRYHSQIVMEKEGREFAADLKASVTTAVIKYKDVNGGAWPERIVLYRSVENCTDIHLFYFLLAFSNLFFLCVLKFWAFNPR